ncbi:MAG: lytic transglycosylase domain-containing protein [Eubacteriales bacterium]|nr:lytic transglycosylase domain-containing protein [Eubacteriales bacterium]
MSAGKKKSRPASRRWLYLAGVAVVLAAALVLLPVAARRVYPYEQRQTIERWAQEYGLDPLWVVAIIRTESSFRPAAVSPAGARGLMQLMPATAQWMAEKHALEYSEEMLLQPAYNVQLGCAYYAYLKERFPENEAALAAWNAGEGNVRRWQQAGKQMTRAEDIPYGETRRFVKKVKDAYEKYRWLYQSN